MMSNKNGFTLIEVLIAAIILFSSIGLIAQLFSASSLAANKASNNTQFYQYAGLAIDSIKTEVRFQYKQDKLMRNTFGELTIGDITFEWQAVLLDKFAPPQPFDETEPPEAVFARYRVAMGVKNTNKVLQESFEMIAW